VDARSIVVHPVDGDASLTQISGSATFLCERSTRISYGGRDKRGG